MKISGRHCSASSPPPKPRCATGLHTHGFGSTARAHMERARAHIQEAYIAINEINRARTVEQLVNDLIRVQQVMDAATRGKSQRI